MKKVFSLFLFAIVFLSACEKEVFVEGPAGPPGPPGEPGNANVNSEAFEVSQWNYSEPLFYADIQVPFITADIISSGAVLVYAKTGEDSYAQLPLTFFQSPDYATTIEVETMPEQVRLYWVDSDLTKPIDPGPQVFKVVALESYDLIYRLDVDLSDYENVRDVFTLEPEKSINSEG